MRVSTETSQLTSTVTPQFPEEARIAADTYASQIAQNAKKTATRGDWDEEVSGVGTGWEDGGWEAHPQVKGDVVHSCVAWHGTTACDETKGVFDRQDERTCNEQIPYDVGG